MFARFGRAACSLAPKRVSHLSLSSNCCRRWVNSESFPPHTSVKMPSAMEGVSEGKLLEWHVKVGDRVDSAHSLCDIEYDDNLTISLSAEEQGYVAEICCEAGQIVPLDTTLARLVSNEESVREFGQSWSAHRRSAKKDLIAAYRMIGAKKPNEEDPFQSHLSLTLPSQSSMNEKVIYTLPYGGQTRWSDVTAESTVKITYHAQKNDDESGSTTTLFQIENRDASDNNHDSSKHIIEAKTFGDELLLSQLELNRSMMAADMNIRCIMFGCDPEMTALSLLDEKFIQNHILSLHPYGSSLFGKRMVFVNEESEIPSRLQEAGMNGTSAIVIRGRGVKLVAPSVRLLYLRWFILNECIKVRSRLVSLIGADNSNVATMNQPSNPTVIGRSSEIRLADYLFDSHCNYLGIHEYMLINDVSSSKIIK